MVVPKGSQNNEAFQDSDMSAWENVSQSRSQAYSVPKLIETIQDSTYKIHVITSAVMKKEQLEAFIGNWIKRKVGSTTAACSYLEL